MSKKNVLLILIFTFLVSCARGPLKHKEEAMRKTKTPNVLDTLGDEHFFETLKKHIDVMRTSGLVKDPMVFGEVTISKQEYIDSLTSIFNYRNDWQNYLKNNFDFYEVYGKENWGEVFTTGYYVPVIAGDLQKSAQFSQPLYSHPTDMIQVNVKRFHPQSFLGTLVGRVENQRLVPYYNRKEIDVDFKLQTSATALAWLDPVDAFFMQIQGSGIVAFPDGSRQMFGYAAQNGHAYTAIGKFLTDVIPKEEMSMQKIRKYLATLDQNARQNILNKNASYVFFQPLLAGALTYAQMEVSAGRTIATDSYLFPKGALAFLDIQEPVFNSLEDETPTSWINGPRFVFDQDTGGAIKGSGRVDLFFGEGDLAAQKAGVMKQTGKLFYLVPKKSN